MFVADGVQTIELKIDAFGHCTTFHPTLLWDAEEAILIDAGMPGQEEQIRCALNDIGLSFSDLKAVILTHQDLDHIGSLPAILNEAQGNIKVYAHNLDKPFIEGDLPLIKTDIHRMSPETLESLPDALRVLYANPPKSKVDHTLADGDDIPFCGGIRVIFTPGHTPGHISLYLTKSKTLVAGDAMVCSDGILRGPIAQTTLDLDMAVESLKTLTQYDIETVVCYHGGVFKDNANRRITELVER